MSMPCFCETNHAPIPQIHTRWPQSIWRAFWLVRGHKGLTSQWDSCSYRRFRTACSLCYMRTQKGYLQNKTPSPATEMAALWPWTSLPPMLWESTCLLFKVPGLLRLSLAAHVQPTCVKSKVSLSSALDPLHGISGKWSLQSPNLM